METSSPQRAAEDGLHVYHEAPQHYIAPKGEEPYYGAQSEKIVTSTEAPHQDRKIAGLRPKAFWIAIIIIGLIVIAASVGGAVGGTRASSKSTSTPAESAIARSVLFSETAPHMLKRVPSLATSSTNVATSASSTAATGTASTLATASATPELTFGYNITTDCPASSGSSYTPDAYFGGPGVYEFRKTCGSNTGGIDLISAFVPDFNTCIDLCSNWNYKIYETGLSAVRCTSAVFLVTGAPPNNCWAKNGTNTLPDQSTGLALLTSG